MTSLAHVSGGHWYEALLYLAPVALMVAALWWSSRRAGDAEADHLEDDDLAR